MASRKKVPGSRAAAPPSYDYYNVNECLNSEGEEEFKQNLKNHFASCTVWEVGVSTYPCKPAGSCAPIGTMYFRFIVLGKGTRGGQNLQQDIYLDRWIPTGTPDLSTPVVIHPVCQNYKNAECFPNPSGGIRKTLSGWQNTQFPIKVTYDTSKSVGGGDGVHFDMDKVNYHGIKHQLELPTQGDMVWEQGPSFRCDAASYASGGGCIFDEIEARMTFSRAKLNATAKEALDHIVDAQERPASTKPGGNGIKIPGHPNSGQPLTRLTPKVTSEEYYYNQNYEVAKGTCKTYFPGWDSQPNHGKQCDEYPFRSTYEGGYYTKLYPGSIWKSSARPIDGKHNGRAGVELGNWYTSDHILAKDPFWVVVQ